MCGMTCSFDKQPPPPYAELWEVLPYPLPQLRNLSGRRQKSFSRRNRSTSYPPPLCTWKRWTSRFSSQETWSKRKLIYKFVFLNCPYKFRCPPWLCSNNIGVGKQISLGYLPSGQENIFSSCIHCFSTTGGVKFQNRLKSPFLAQSQMCIFILVIWI